MAQSTYPIPPPPGQQFSPYTPSYGPASQGAVSSVSPDGKQDVSDGLGPEAALAFGILPISSAAGQQAFDPSGGLATPNGSGNGILGGAGGLKGGQQLPPGSAYVSQKHNRLRRACDACSVRKVKVRF